MAIASQFPVCQVISCRQENVKNLKGHAQILITILTFLTPIQKLISSLQLLKVHSMLNQYQIFEQFIMRKYQSIDRQTCQKKRSGSLRLCNNSQIFQISKSTMLPKEAIFKHNSSKMDIYKSLNFNKNDKKQGRYAQNHNNCLFSPNCKTNKNIIGNSSLKFKTSLGTLIREVTDIKQKLQILTLRKNKACFDSQHCRQKSNKRQKLRYKNDLPKSYSVMMTPMKAQDKNKNCNNTISFNNQSFQLVKTPTIQNGKNKSLCKCKSINKGKPYLYESNQKNIKQDGEIRDFKINNYHQQRVLSNSFLKTIQIQLLQDYNKQLFRHNKLLQRQIKHQNKQKSKLQNEKLNNHNNQSRNNQYKSLVNKKNQSKRDQSYSNSKNQIKHTLAKHCPQSQPPIRKTIKKHAMSKNKQTTATYEQQITLKYSNFYQNQVQKSKVSLQNSQAQSLLLDCLAIQCNQQMILKQKKTQNKKSCQRQNKQKTSQKTKDKVTLRCNKQNQELKQSKQNCQFDLQRIRQRDYNSIRTPQIKQTKQGHIQSNQDYRKLQQKLQILTMNLKDEQQKQRHAKLKLRQQISQIAHQLNIKKGSWYLLKSNKNESPSNPRWLL